MATPYTKKESASLTAQNTFCAGVEVRGQLVVSISGTWVATITLQRSHDTGATWHDITDYISNTEITLEDKTGTLYRAGVKTGNFTSGTVAIYQSAE